MAGETGEAPPPFPRSPLLQVEGRPLVVTLTALILVMFNLNLLSDLVFKEGPKAGVTPLIALGMVIAGLGYWVMRRFAPVLVALCTVAMAVLLARMGKPAAEVVQIATKYGIYILPGVLYWKRMK